MSDNKQLAKINQILAKTGGRDKVMSVIQFLPDILTPVAVQLGRPDIVKQLAGIAAQAATYRSVTRLSGVLAMVQGGLPPISQNPAALFRFLSWVCDFLFFPMENLAVLARDKIIGLNTPETRLVQYGPRCVFFWFYSLVFKQLQLICEIFSLQNENDRKKLNDKLEEWLIATMWFLLAWSYMPPRGAPVQLLANPNASLLKPLHVLVEAMTVPGLPAGPFLKGVFGFTASALTLNKEWQMTRV